MLTTNKENPTPFDIAMMALSVVSMTIIASVYLLALESETKRLMLMIDSLICFVFISHFISRLISANNKKYYLRHNGLDLLASIPFVEQLRFLRFLQIFRVISMIRSARSFFVTLVRERVKSTLALLLVMLVLIITTSAVFIFSVEHGLPNSNIKSAEDALWWALVTVSTVGYGDSFPVTTGGRLVASLLIISGVSLFGVLSGYIASNFVKPDKQNKPSQQEILLEKLLADNDKKHQDLLAEIQQLKAQVNKLEQQQ